MCNSKLISEKFRTCLVDSNKPGAMQACRGYERGCFIINWEGQEGLLLHTTLFVSTVLFKTRTSPNPVLRIF